MMGMPESSGGHFFESEKWVGALPASFPFVDAETAYLAYAVTWWRRYFKLVQGAKTALRPKAEIEGLAKLEAATRRATQKALKAHPLWPWLEQFPGVRGTYTAYILHLIKDPRRFPGQQCEEGHYLPDIFVEGVPCPFEQRAESELRAETCGAPLHGRRGTGVRSLWHYFGLHVIDGKRARKRKGKAADWVTEAPGILLGPQGIADQIIRHRVEPWRSRYDHEKERIADERGVLDGDRVEVGSRCESENQTGPARSPNGDGSEVDRLAESEASHGLRSSDGSEVVAGNESESEPGLRPVRIHTIARTIALKAFVGDLLIAWKAVAHTTEEV